METVTWDYVKNDPCFTDWLKSTGRDISEIRQDKLGSLATYYYTQIMNRRVTTAKNGIIFSDDLDSPGDVFMKKMSMS